MKIDSAIKNFTEKYDFEAISYIENIANERGNKLNDHMIQTFNITEAFNNFNQYLKGYADYKIKNINNPRASSQDAIKESVNKFINENLFRESSTLYRELPNFVMGYIDGVNTILETVDNIKSEMYDAEVDQDAIGDINDFTDQFMDKLHESFDPTMDRILMASGYTSHQLLFGKNRPNHSVTNHTFL